MEEFKKVLLRAWINTSLVVDSLVALCCLLGLYVSVVQVQSSVSCVLFLATFVVIVLAFRFSKRHVFDCYKETNCDWVSHTISVLDILSYIGLLLGWLMLIRDAT